MKTKVGSCGHFLYTVAQARDQGRSSSATSPATTHTRQERHPRAPVCSWATPCVWLQRVQDLRAALPGAAAPCTPGTSHTHGPRLCHFLHHCLHRCSWLQCCPALSQHQSELGILKAFLQSNISRDFCSAWVYTGETMRAVCPGLELSPLGTTSQLINRLSLHGPSGPFRPFSSPCQGTPVS